MPKFSVTYVSEQLLPMSPVYTAPPATGGELFCVQDLLIEKYLY